MATRRAQRRAVKLDWLAGESRGLEHADARFDGADLTEAVLAESAFHRCEFVGARFNCARLSEVELVDCVFSGCNFSDAELEGAWPAPTSPAPTCAAAS
jgi:uncharacterized protein YjbI with pentapeptide repeats